MAVNEQAEFVDDGRIKKAEEIVQEVEKLGLPQTIREIAAFAPKKKDSKWMGSVINGTARRQMTRSAAIFAQETEKTRRC